jgi:hypothetical protein
MVRTWVFLAIVVAGACSKKQDKPKPVVDKPAVKAEAEAIEGPSVTPVKTESVAFVVPKDSKFWGEMNFACYRAAMSLTGTRTAGEAFEKMSPTVPEAMAAGGIDLGRDMAAMGGFECNGSPCLYVAATLAKPEAMGKVLEKLLPGTPQKTIAPGHYTIDTKGSSGTRTIHVRVVPIAWTAKPTGDAWVTESGRATHVVFIGGVDGKNVDVDPVALLADAQTGLAHVKDAEGVLGDARGRCILGRVGATDFQPGFKLDHGRFAMAAAPGKNDALMAMLDSQRTLDLTVELTLSPAPKDADAKSWIAQGRAWAGNIALPIRAQFAGNPMLDAYLDMLALLGNRGFKHEIADKALRFSWRTDRVPRGELDALEKRFSALLAQ